MNTIAERFSKIGSIPELEKQNITEATSNSFNYLKSRISKKVSFEFQAPDQVIMANINLQLYSWVIEKLVKNAVDAMEGKGAIKIVLKQQKEQVYLQVSDTGKGIPKALQYKIFSPGFTTKKRGWGLGLSLAKRIIEDYHSGKIGVLKSEIGKGTTFQIILNKL